MTMDMKELREKISATGFDTSNIDDDMLRQLAKAVGLKAPPAPKAELVEYTSNGTGKVGIYVKTPNVMFQDAKGAKDSARGAFVRVEAVEQMIEDLKLGLELARKKGLVE
jgi:hypothetical protein